MKLIEAMKRVKMNKEKIVDLHDKIKANSAHLSHETPQYDDPKAKVREWMQSCFDLGQENIRLLCAIQRTNLVTPVTINLSGRDVTKSIAAWVWRRREYAAIDATTISVLTDRGLKEGMMQTSTGSPFEVKLVRNFSVEERDTMRSILRTEPSEIDSALEIINATTDLIEE